MAVRIHPHARDRMQERGIREAEVHGTVESGERFPAKFGRSGFRRNFTFGAAWRGKHYESKQVEAFAVQEGPDWLVITVIARYLGPTGEGG